MLIQVMLQMVPNMSRICQVRTTAEVISQEKKNNNIPLLLCIYVNALFIVCSANHKILPRYIRSCVARRVCSWLNPYSDIAFLACKSRVTRFPFDHFSYLYLRMFFIEDVEKRGVML
jgi:hypothetical protein